jgi:hypothetical protein
VRRNCWRAPVLPKRSPHNGNLRTSVSEGPETPPPWQATQGKTLGRGSRVSATATFRRNPDGANRARDSVKPGEVANDQG